MLNLTLGRGGNMEEDGNEDEGGDEVGDRTRAIGEDRDRDRDGKKNAG